jgi:hypothetical protein
MLRADYNLNNSHTIDARYNINNATEVNPAGQVPSYLPRSYVARAQSITVGDTYTITASLLNQFRISYNRDASVIDPNNRLSLSGLGGNFPVIGGEKIPPAITISGRATLGSNSSIDAAIVNETKQLSDNLSWTKGRHTVKAGFEVMRLR